MGVTVLRLASSISGGNRWMKRRRGKSREPIHAAGGIVIRGNREPLIAIVQLRKCNSWVLPKGKLNRNETPLAAARREVLEEVGHKVYVHEFLGAIAYEVGSRSKVVQFWRMQAIGEPAGPVMNDVKAVAWLPLDDAIDRLSRSREQVFLRSVGPAALDAVAKSARKARSAVPAVGRTLAEPADDTDVANNFNLEELIESAGHASEVRGSEAADHAPETSLEPVQVEQRVADAAAELPRQDRIKVSGSFGRHGIVQRVRLWFRRISPGSTQPGRRN
jgi:8-oxo-dGTP diphosphatase